MVRILPIKSISDRKKMLLLQNKLHRHTLRVQVDAFTQSCEVITGKIKIFSIGSMALSALATVGGLWVAKMRAPTKKGLISRVISGFAFFNQAKGVFARFKDHLIHQQQDR